MAEYYDFDTNVNDNIYTKKPKEKKETFIETKTGLAKVFLLMFNFNRNVVTIWHGSIAKRSSSLQKKDPDRRILARVISENIRKPEISFGK